MKKIISKILAAALIISVLPSYPVSAEEEGNTAAVVAAEKQGDSGNDGETKNFEGFEYSIFL